ncbi:MAG TPA: acylneuraminate cytidylyltransferase family protein [Polyangia bacterium]
MTLPRQMHDAKHGEAARDGGGSRADIHPVLAVIPARGGSKGLPGKNLRAVAGIPLIGHAIRCAQRVPGIARIVVSTDSPEIAAVARDFGADGPFLRPAELSGDNAPTVAALQHALAFVEAEEGRHYGALLLLEPTSPGRLPEDIEGTFALLQARPDVDGVVGCSVPHFNPYYVGVIEREGVLAPAIPRPAGLTRRQDAPPFLRINGAVYLWRRDFLASAPADWTVGRHVPFVIPDSRAVSIDELADLLICEAMIEKGQWQLPWLAPGVEPVASKGAAR